jgi:methionyl aminopeptidase
MVGKAGVATRPDSIFRRVSGETPAPRAVSSIERSPLARAKDAGALVARILQTLRSRSSVGTNLLDIDRWTKAMILEAGALSCYVDYEPSFGRGPFGHHVCTAVNDAVLHGRPHDYRLADGDLLTLDLAVSQGGVAADSAVSFIVGEARPPESVAMIEVTERALHAGIAAAGPGARIGDISHAIGSTMHQDPHVPNTGRPGRGYRLRPVAADTRGRRSRSQRISRREPSVTS